MAEGLTDTRLMKHLMESSKDNIYFMDRDGRIILINQAGAEWLGFNSPEELIGKTNLDIFTAEHGCDACEDEQRIMRTGVPILGKEEKETWADGHETWVSTSKFPLWDDDGEIVGTFGISRDITNHKQAAALYKSEERFRSIVESISDWVWEVDADGVYIYCSNKVETILGYQPDEMIGKTPFDFMPPDEAERVGALFSETAREKRVFRDLENWNLTKNGRRVCLLTSGVPILGDDGKLLGYRGVDSDVTEYKRAAAERERLITAIDQAAETVVITDVEGAIEYVNPAFKAATGYTSKEAIGQNPRILKSGKQDDAFYKELWNRISSGQSWSGHFQNKRKDGSLYTEEAVISPVYNTSGTIVNYVAVKRDITKELQLEEQYRQAQKMDAVGQLAGGVAHDFNNILQAILGYCGMLLMETEEQESLRQDVLEIQHAAKHAAKLTRQLLTFSRKQSVDYTVQNINTIIGEEREMLCRLIGENIQLVSKLDPDLKSVKADLGQMGQVIMNLVVNAQDAMPDGGRITIGTENITEKDASAIPELRKGEHVCLSVSDTGTGMNEESREHLFEPFFTTKTAENGTGLGLAVVYGIIQQHEGWVDVVSKLGQGTMFRIYLPVSDDAEARPKAKEAEAYDFSVDYGRGARILLVEDDPEVRKLSLLILQEAGYSVMDAESAKQAMDIFERENGNFALIFSDVVLPDQNGIQLADSLLKKKAGLSVVLFSGYLDKRIDLDSIKEKGFYFLRKPFQPETLLNTVRQVLAGVLG